MKPNQNCTIVKVFFVCVFECSDFTGSVLRVDVDTDCCTSPYSIPRNNPYFNSTNQPPEIFAHGLHDPGRCVKLLMRNFSNVITAVPGLKKKKKRRRSTLLLQLIQTFTVFFLFFTSVKKGVGFYPSNYPNTLFYICCFFKEFCKQSGETRR